MTFNVGYEADMASFLEFICELDVMIGLKVGQALRELLYLRTP